MKILVISPHLPLPTWGGGARTYYLVKALASVHDVTVLAPKPLPDERLTAPLDETLAPRLHMFERTSQPPKRWQQLAGAARGVSYLATAHESPEFQAAADALLARGSYDLVFFESIFVAGLRLPPGMKVIIDQHNIEHEMLARTAEQEQRPLRRWYNRLEGRLLAPIELDRCCRADMVVVTSERERDIFTRLLPGTRFEVVPNGVDTSRFQPQGDTEEVPGRIVFTGAMRHYPNTHAAVTFAERCWPLIHESAPEATWQIVGSDPPPSVLRLAELPGVEVLGTVPDMRPYLAAAQVAIAPLLIGSGTRLKILEAFAMRKAMVSTALGCEGLSVISGTHLLIEDEPDAMAHAVVSILRNGDQRRALGAAGRELVEARYDWERCGSMLLTAVERLAEQGVGVDVGD